MDACRCYGQFNSFFWLDLPVDVPVGHYSRPQSLRFFGSRGRRHDILKRVAQGTRMLVGILGSAHAIPESYVITVECFGSSLERGKNWTREHRRLIQTSFSVFLALSFSRSVRPSTVTWKIPNLRILLSALNQRENVWEKANVWEKEKSRLYTGTSKIHLDNANSEYSRSIRCHISDIGFTLL